MNENGPGRKGGGGGALSIPLYATVEAENTCSLVPLHLQLPKFQSPLNYITSLLSRPRRSVMDIEDILRDADPSYDSIPSGNHDLQLLTRAWVAERSAPEVLLYGPLLHPITLALTC